MNEETVELYSKQEDKVAHLYKVQARAEFISLGKHRPGLVRALFLLFIPANQ